jgi:tetratricopeptide (TPR) repeat protein
MPVLIALSLFIATYFFIFVFWSVPTMRYQATLIPLVLVFLIRSFQVLLSNRSRWIVLTGAVVIALSYGYENSYAVYQSLWVDNPHYQAPFRSLAWFQQRTTPHDYALSPIAPSLYLYGHRQGMSLLYAHDPEEFRYLLAKNHLGYIVDRPVKMIRVNVPNAVDSDQEWDHIRRWIALSPEHFERIYYNAQEEIVIYRVSPDPGFFKAYECYLLAVGELNQHHWKEGLALIAQSHRWSPSLACAYNAEAASDLLENEKLTVPEQILHHALQLQPDYPIALLNLARIYHAQGKMGQATRLLQKAVDASWVQGDITQFSEVLNASQQMHQIDLTGLVIPRAHAIDMADGGFDSVVQ